MYIDKFWRSETNRKQFFDSFAAQKGFEYNDVESWYRQSTSDIAKEQVSKERKRNERGRG